MQILWPENGAGCITEEAGHVCGELVPVDRGTRFLAINAEILVSNLLTSTRQAGMRPEVSAVSCFVLCGFSFRDTDRLS
jgi:hypothetical protein